MEIPLDVLDIVVSFGWPDAMVLVPAPNRWAEWAKYCHYGRTTHVLLTVRHGRALATYIRIITNGRSKDVFDSTLVFSEPSGRKYTELYTADSAHQRAIVDRLWYCTRDMCAWNALNTKPRRSRMGNVRRTGPGTYWKDVWLPRNYPDFCVC